MYSIRITIPQHELWFGIVYKKTYILGKTFQGSTASLEYGDGRGMLEWKKESTAIKWLCKARDAARKQFPEFDAKPFIHP